ncbi:mediator of RNA polymerase II transcription subunit 25-like isoform X4 [Nymphalis io]|uniref:mediator of RNA polymerase II transcription subunit 25-like isoform X4 n=1 Tax=Inachis io TaxID=171585 RepID=UPI0021677744|nr:mediator of RNA polymerase II transcription subunit 25-like isoform X4 [Nymphalis io]
MVVNAPDSPIQAEVIFVVEATSANGAYISELKTNYIIPTLEYFHGGAIEEGVGSGSVYGIVTYQAADCHPDLPVSTYGPFTCPQNVVDTIDKLQFIGGHAESRACVTEGLTAALACLEDLGRSDIPLHVILLCCSPPYSAYTGGLVPPGAPATVEQAAKLIGERGAHLSVAAAKKLPALLALYEHAGGELHTAQQRNYAKDPRHLVLLHGYSLKERPPSPAPPPPVAEVQQPEMYGQNRPPVPQQRAPPAQFQRGTIGPVRNNWLTPPRQAPYANSALLTQLSQPSYPPPTQTNMQRLQGIQAGPSSAGAFAASPAQRTYIWSGVLEWMEKGKTPGDQKVTRHLPCQVSANSKDAEPELKVDTWPNKLVMQLMHKQLISNIGGQYLKDSKSVLFHLQQNEALEALTKIMVNGFAGCVHFSPTTSPPQCDIKVLILLYTPDKKAYLGFIPNNQATFVDRLRKVIQQQKMNKQMPTTAAMAGGQNIGAGNMQSGMGISGGGMAGSMSAMPSMSNQQTQQHQQGMMISSNMGTSVGQVNQGQISQQTLEAAHQQEAQFKSQMDIMSHLHAAQQQEQHYKQLEEQQRKAQLQAQLQQLRGAGARLVRPLLPANPGLRHLLQQQPQQYRPGSGAVRPNSQTQQYDEMSNYNDFI